MNVREAIKRLQMIEAEHGGDLPVVAVSEVEGFFCIEEEHVFDVIDIPDGEDTEQRAVAFMCPVDEEATKPPLRAV